MQSSPKKSQIFISTITTITRSTRKITINNNIKLVLKTMKPTLKAQCFLGALALKAHMRIEH